MRRDTEFLEVWPFFSYHNQKVDSGAHPNASKNFKESIAYRSITQTFWGEASGDFQMFQSAFSMFEIAHIPSLLFHPSSCRDKFFLFVSVS
jgi:hypothetical protein